MWISLNRWNDDSSYVTSRITCQHLLLFPTIANHFCPASDTYSPLEEASLDYNPGSVRLAVKALNSRRDATGHLFSDEMGIATTPDNP